MLTKYIIVFILLIAAELLYFRLADHFNIIDKPNERSSHSKVVLRGGGIIFVIGVWIWSAFFGFPYPWFLTAVTLVAGISFVDDIHPLPDLSRLAVQFVAMGMVFWQLGMFRPGLWWMVFPGLVVWVGATNIYNFMDGINGITAGYSLAVLVPLLLVNLMPEIADQAGNDVSLIIVSILAVLVFAWFNFRPKNKARCFAGDVGSMGIAFVLMFLVGRLVIQTRDLGWLVFLVVYAVDGLCTIAHRMQLHEHIGEAHRKHAYQLMANELGMDHVVVSLIYMALQLALSLVMIYLVPNTPIAHLIYLLAVFVVLSGVYVAFMKKYYHLHEEYLESLK